KAHLEGFGSEEGVRKAKGELYDHLRENKGMIFLMEDYDYLKEMSKGIPKIFSYGTMNADIEGNILLNEPFLEIGITKGVNLPSIKTQLIGEYNFSNVLAAAAVGKYFKTPDEKIKLAIETYTPSNSRS